MKQLHAPIITHSQIYIDKGESAWTTRFGIVAKDGDSLVPEAEKTQPDGMCVYAS